MCNALLPSPAGEGGPRALRPWWMRCRLRSNRYKRTVASFLNGGSKPPPYENMAKRLNVCGKVDEVSGDNARPYNRVFHIPKTPFFDLILQLFVQFGKNFHTNFGEFFRFPYIALFGKLWYYCVVNKISKLRRVTNNGTKHQNTHSRRKQ